MFPTTLPYSSNRAEPLGLSSNVTERNAAISASDVLNSISIDTSFKAARITARPGDKLRFRVYDADFVGDDLVGEWDKDVMSLALGDQAWTHPAGRLISVMCRVLPLDGVDAEALTK